MKSELDAQFEYIIVSCCPEIHLAQCDDVEKLNEVLDEINSENPDMTAEYLGMLLTASGLDIFDSAFIHKASANDFAFEDLSDFDCGTTAEAGKASKFECAARYLVSELGVPFDGISREALRVFGSSSVADYINWDEVWNQYAAMGFTIAADSDGCGVYLIYWRK